jgi:hypothetical protein
MARRVEAVVLTDARDPGDPTGTSNVRRAWGAAARLRLRQVRAALRVAVMETDVLGLTAASAVAVHSGAVRMDVWRHIVRNALYRQLSGSWALPFVRRAWAKGETDADSVPGTLSSAHIETLLNHELDGIIAAIVAALARMGFRHFTSRAQAWAAIATVFDHEVERRVPALISVLVTTAYNRGKVETYRARGVERVGIVPEQRPEPSPSAGFQLSPLNRAALAVGAVVGAHALARELRPSRWVKNEQTGAWEFKRGRRAERALRRAFPEGQPVAVQTAEDDRVCDTCDSIADGSPYSLDAAMDLLPVHIGCRCAIVEWTGDDEDDDAVTDAAPVVVRLAPVQLVFDFDPDEPRDPYGKWAVGGAGLGLPREEDDPEKKKDWAAHVRKTLHRQIELALTVGGGALGASLGGIVGGILGSTVGALGGKQVTRLLGILERRDFTHAQAVHAVARELGVKLADGLTDAELEDRYQATRAVLRDALVILDAFDPAQWAEELHPRGEHGRWSTKGGKEGAQKESPYAHWYRTHPARQAAGPAQKELWPGKFPPISEPKKQANLDDFTKAHIPLDESTRISRDKSEKFLKSWNEHIGEAPEQFRDEFIGGKGTMTLQYDEHRDALNIQGTMTGDHDESLAYYTREINFRTNSAESSYFKVKNEEQGSGLGKQFLAANIAIYQKLGLDQVDVHANIDVGGYAWAKYGYVPTESSWRTLSADLCDAVEGGSGGHEPESWDELTDSEQERIGHAWERDVQDEFYDSEVESWRDSGGPLGQAKTELAENYTGDADKGDKWLWEGAKGYAVTLGEGDDVKGQSMGPFLSEHGLSVEQVMAHTTFEYEDRHGDGRGDPDVTIDWDKVAGADKLSEDHQSQIEGIFGEVFNKAAERNAVDVDPPDHLVESARSLATEIWEQKSAREKWRWASDNGKIPERAPEPSDVATGSETDHIRELLDDPDPKSIWELSDTKAGKDLLLGTDWNGTLDLHDADSMARFNAYVGKKK